MTSIREHQGLVEAARLMRESDVEVLAVMGPNHQLVGMLTDRDIVVRTLAFGSDPRQICAGDLAQGPPVTLEVDDDVSDAVDVMRTHHVRHLPVLDHGRLVGIVSSQDTAGVATL